MHFIYECTLILFVFRSVKSRIIENEYETKCQVYDENNCFGTDNNCSIDLNETKDENLPDVQIKICDPGKLNYCFVLWTNDSNGKVILRKKDCFSNDQNCAGKKKCVNHEKKNNLHYCCCEGDLCNQEFHYEPINSPLPSVDLDNTTASDDYSLTIKIIIIPIFIVCIVAITFVYRKQKFFYFNRNSQNMQRSQAPPSPVTDRLLPIELVEVIAKGRFGVVWKAKLKAETVAVKVVPAQNKQSWQTEQEVFKLPFMDHENIVQFIGAEKRGINLHADYWLITAYHELGSLCDFLKENTVTWEQLCLISFTMARGLAHLHEEIPSNKPECCKPSIAHRDLKSNNILLKSDMTACIADFGLALIFRSQVCSGSHGQVGTRRYMAPEVLEGVINFANISFLRVDMYSCGLVLWEILTRCNLLEDSPSKYKLPFEAELGEHPTIETMQDFVVNRKLRPELKDSWRLHEKLSNVCETIEECWDSDAEARLSASCVTERFSGHLCSSVKSETKLLYNIV